MQLQVYYAALLQVNNAVSIQVHNVAQEQVFDAKLQKSMASVQTTGSINQGESSQRVQT